MNVTSTRDRILKAAFELISVKGYLATSTREIAKQAKVAEVTLFRQFTNKEGLFAEVLRSFSAIPVLAALMPQLQTMPYRKAIDTLTHQFLEQIEAHRDWVRVLHHEVDHAPDEMKNIYIDFLEQLFSVLTVFFTDALKHGFVRNDLNPGLAARAFHSMIFGFFHVEGLREIKAGHVTEYAEMVDVFVDIFCRGTMMPD
jgi:AcrR family transcriptional regulator